MSEDTKAPNKLEPPIVRDAQGRVVSGKLSGGSGGRTRLSDIAKGFLESGEPKAWQRLMEALDATKIQGDDELPDHDVRLKAIAIFLERKYGKAPQAITGEDGSPLHVGVIVLPAEGIIG